MRKWIAKYVASYVSAMLIGEIRLATKNAVKEIAATFPAKSYHNGAIRIPLSSGDKFSIGVNADQQMVTFSSVSMEGKITVKLHINEAKRMLSSLSHMLGPL